jgi:hypothetical protein
MGKTKTEVCISVSHSSYQSGLTNADASWAGVKTSFKSN